MIVTLSNVVQRMGLVARPAQGETVSFLMLRQEPCVSPFVPMQPAGRTQPVSVCYAATNTTN